MVRNVRNSNLDNSIGLETNGHEKDLPNNRRTNFRIDTFILTLSY